GDGQDKHRNGKQGDDHRLSFQPGAGRAARGARRACGGRPASSADQGFQDGDDDGGQDRQAVADGGGAQRGLRTLHLTGVPAGHQVPQPAHGQEQGRQAGQDPGDPLGDVADHLVDRRGGQDSGGRQGSDGGEGGEPGAAGG